MKKITLVIICTALIAGCKTPAPVDKKESWSISVIPSSVRIDPVTNQVIDNRFVIAPEKKQPGKDILKKNHIFDGTRASLSGARGEYISFQVVITSGETGKMDNIRIDIPAFSNQGSPLKVKPEKFLEWSVEVKDPSTGYPEASLGKGWYPDALIPFSCIQDDSSQVRHRWTYPLWLPDFNNRIPGQKSLIIWVDQYIPFNRDEARPGLYSSEINVKTGNIEKSIPVDLNIWDFAIPNENSFKACLQHEGFMRELPAAQELEIYQLFKRNRIVMLDPTYDPGLTVTGKGQIVLDWKSFDERLGKYFSGEAFTAGFGYEYGPGYGEPIETFVLPFDVYGKHGTRGWPDTGKPDVERNEANREVYTGCIEKVREHFKNLIDPGKTEITVYLNGLDESYFPEAWSRMVYYGDLFKKYYPEAKFRIDGGYTEEALQIVKNSISSWASHTIEYDYPTIKKYQDMGIRVWLYGPMLYESKINSWVGSSTFIDLPLVNDRAISWSCWKYNTYSWISWGAGAGWINGWYDPESWKDASKATSEKDSEFTFKKLNGNALLIYAPGVVPNVDVTCPSIRLKMMRDGVQEYEYLRLLSQLDNGRERADSVVNSIIKQPFGPKSIGNLDVWNFDAYKWDQARLDLGSMIEKSEKEKNITK